MIKLALFICMEDLKLMRILKRSILEVTNRLKKSLLILLIITTILTLIIIGMSILETVKRAGNEAKSELKAELLIQNNSLQQGGLDENKGENYLNKNILQRVENTKGVVKAEVVINTFVSTNLKMVGSRTSETKEGSPTNRLYGFDNVEDNPDFVNGKYKLIKGTLPFNSKVDNPILISNKFAEMNHLKVGDAIFVKGGESLTKKIRYVITGLFEAREEASDNRTSENPVSNIENTFYSTVQTTEKTKSLDNPSQKAQYEEIKVTIDNVENVRLVIASLKRDKSVNWENFSFISDFEQYDRVTSSIDDISNIASLTIWISGGFGIIILTLVMIISLRDRKFEIGVLLSLGETRIGIVIQMLLEIFIIFIVSFTLAIGGSRVISQNVDNVVTIEQSGQAKKNTGHDKDNTLSKKDSDRSKKKSSTNNQVLINSFLLGMVIITLPTLSVLIIIFQRDPKYLMLKND